MCILLSIRREFASFPPSFFFSDDRPTRLTFFHFFQPSPPHPSLHPPPSNLSLSPAHASPPATLFNAPLALVTQPFLSAPPCSLPEQPPLHHHAYRTRFHNSQGLLRLGSRSQTGYPLGSGGYESWDQRRIEKGVREGGERRRSERREERREEGCGEEFEVVEGTGRGGWKI